MEKQNGLNLLFLYFAKANLKFNKVLLIFSIIQHNQKKKTYLIRRRNCWKYNRIAQSRGWTKL